jgi:hypothetical protein
MLYKSENKFHGSPPGRGLRGGLIIKDIYFLIYMVYNKN